MDYDKIEFPMKMPVQSSQPLIITLCGSYRFLEAFKIAYYEFSAAGFIVLLPVFDAPMRDKEQVIALHDAKIDMSNYVCVITDSSRYIGLDTKREIQYAEEHRIPWFLYKIGGETK